MYDLAGKRIWVAGHRGMVGSAVVRRLAPEGCALITAGRDQLDLMRQVDVEAWMAEARPDAVVLAAAKVGGILANDSYPADFLYENLMIEANIIEASRTGAVWAGCCFWVQVLHLSRNSHRSRLQEDALLTGPLEPTNQWYAIAKIAGIKLAQAYRKQHGCDFISAMPTNLYGPGDNFDLQSSHVLPALIRKAHEAKLRGDAALTIWGTGMPRREFLHADDCADALVFLLKTYSAPEHVNVGSGEDITILDLARLVCEVVGFDGEIRCDTSKPDGTMRKLMDGGKLKAAGWSPRIALRQGVTDTYARMLEEHPELRG